MRFSFDAKQKLVPATVPWMVSPSTPYLRLIATEGYVTEVMFAAYFGLSDEVLNTKNPSVIAHINVAIVDNPYNVPEKLEGEGGAYRVVKLQFQGGLWSRMYPSFSDREILNPSLFDFSSVGCGYNPVHDIDKWLSGFRQEWRRTSICPDPGFYQVKDSLWIQEIKANESEYKHFIIKGHDAYVEVIAQDWSWESESTLNGW